jgi:hypothetical protein
MYFEINVALNGKHYFATSERSIRSSKKAAEVVADFEKRFPENEGFSISLSYNPQKSYGVCLPEVMPTDINKLERWISDRINKIK